MTDPETKPPNKLARLGLPPLLLALAVALVYGHTGRSPFLLDDTFNIVENPAIRRLWPLAEALDPPPVDMTFYTRPFINLTMCVDYALGGLNPETYHRTNFLFHWAAALALFGLARRTLRRTGMEDGAAWTVGLAAALVWAVHPLNTAAVSYLSQRGELGVGLFLFLMLYGLNRAAAPGAVLGGVFWLAAAVFSCLLGMGSKESMAAAPLLALAYDRIFLSATWKEALRRRGPFYVALALTWAWPLSRILTFSPHLPEDGFDPLPFRHYALTQAWGLSRMLGLAIWPRGLVFEYGTGLVSSPADVWPQLLFMATALALSAWAVLRRPRAGFAALLFLAVMAPSSILPITGQPVAEHRLYAALAAPAALAAWGLWRLLRERPWAWRALVAAWIAALGLASRQRNELYNDPLRLWSDTLAKRPSNDRAWGGLGQALDARGRHAEALRAYELALRRKDSRITRSSMGTTLYNLGRYPEALRQFQASLRLHASDAKALHWLGLTLAALNRHEEAIEAQRRALSLQPDYVAACFQAARSLVALRYLEEGLAAYREAARLQPTALEAHSRIALTLLALGRADEARAALLDGARASGAPARAYFEFSNALLAQGHAAEALDMARRHLELEPAHPGSLNNAAWILATSTNTALLDGDEAVRLAQRAMAQSGATVPALWATLAAAQAEAGRFDEAAASGERALALAREANATNLLASYALRLEAYRGRRPWREGGHDDAAK
ncbi:MAG TPA: tetratricopeptide repeat protein [Kiritimatiellia bacterium]|nr:tetratricopeptide repeat protein [Kiritimatiellia bacterium]HRZ11672.1 tetratricopeptide repeat protein [Kiritimatiellia bacterium]HSA16777.1 tetratricopeptide repeat protein [Kiritimatiellia bacterium]